MSGLNFPRGFLWGASTAAHQVEGGNHNDWTEWEKAGHTLDKSQSGAAADNWNLYKTDFALLSELNLNAYRFSIEWSRIEPREGEFNEAALAHYGEMIAELKRRNITPLVTLHHYTLPLWVSQKGGWENRHINYYFSRFALKVVERFGSEVALWCTINEPTILSSLGYIVGSFPPGKHSLWAFIKVQRHLIKAHKRMYSEIHRLYVERGWQRPTVMFAHNMVYAVPRSAGRLDKLDTWLYQFFADNYVLRSTRKHIDAVGLNYYFYHRISFKLGKPGWVIHDEDLLGSPPASDLGWHIHPEGLYKVLSGLKSLNKPIYITENGLADAKDEIRPWSIVRHLQAVHKALAEGVDVRGYFHWSLIDTFEWDNGYRSRYGLVAVDFKTQKRTVRKSGRLYAEIAKADALPDNILERYQ